MSQCQLLVYLIFILYKHSGCMHIIVLFCTNSHFEMNPQIDIKKILRKSFQFNSNETLSKKCKVCIFPSCSISIFSCWWRMQVFCGVCYYSSCHQQFNFSFKQPTSTTTPPCTAVLRKVPSTNFRLFVRNNNFKKILLYSRH